MGSVQNNDTPRHANKCKATIPSVNTYPAAYLMAPAGNQILQLIVVGSVDRFGTKTTFSQGTGAEVTTYALGEDVLCANGDGGASVSRSGTSFCEF